jgi:hypothetical protein
MHGTSCGISKITFFAIEAPELLLGRDEHGNESASGGEAAPAGTHQLRLAQTGGSHAQLMALPP